MARIRLEADDPSLRMTLKTLLESDGHVMDALNPEVEIVDTPREAVKRAKARPTLLLSTASALPEAIKAMRQGVYGYIFLPLVPGEASQMVQRALGGQTNGVQAPPAPRPLDEVEREHILTVLRQCRNNQAEAARLLRIGRNTLWRKVKQFSEAE